MKRRHTNGESLEEQMSGVPNRDGVKKLRMALRDIAWERERLDECGRALAQAKSSLEGHKQALLKARQEVEQLMVEMDISSTGNCGYEGRRFELLLMLASEGI